MKLCWKVMLLCLSLLSVSSVVRAAPEPITIHGAGATFPYPLYSKWFFEYHKLNPSVQFNYQSIGSGGGIRQITSQTVDFGASDAPMEDADLQKTQEKILHIPTVLGAVVLSYNQAGLPNNLKLSGTVIADIFLGKITKWNDPALVKLNPGVALPNAALFVAHRSDGSGTTHVFSDYLSKVSPAWKAQVGTGKALSWPVGLGAKGNEGVTGIIQQTPGSIGYIELGYAMQNKLNVAAVQNSNNEFIAPSIAATSAAARGALANMPADYRVSITNAAGAGAYPISAFTYLLVPEQQKHAAKGQEMVKFLRWAMSDGQKQAPSLHYAPLPAELIARIEKTIGSIKVSHAEK